MSAWKKLSVMAWQKRRAAALAALLYYEYTVPLRGPILLEGYRVRTERAAEHGLSVPWRKWPLNSPATPMRRLCHQPVLASHR